MWTHRIITKNYRVNMIKNIKIVQIICTYRFWYVQQQQKLTLLPQVLGEVLVPSNFTNILLQQFGLKLPNSIVQFPCAKLIVIHYSGDIVIFNHFKPVSISS